MHWVKKEIDAVKAREMCDQFGISLLLAVILLRRNILSPEDIQFFLEDDLRFLHNPFVFKDMTPTVNRIRQAVTNREKILVYGDRDVDGITATVLLVEALTEHGADVSWNVPLGDDDYGLSPADVDAAAAAGVSLLCTVDCGISNTREIAYARSRGIDVIVIDHHNPQHELPEALAIINPKVAESGYPFLHLSGCGVASKVDWALGFSRSVFYGRIHALVLITPLNDSYSVQAARFSNLVETGSFRENVVPDVGADFLKRLLEFIDGAEIIVHDGHVHARLAEKIWGTDAGAVGGTDFQEWLARDFPAVAGKSLLAIREMSRLGKYAARDLTEMDMFKSLFVSAMHKNVREQTAAAAARLDLAALGTIADLMPLVNENRIIVRHGLDLMASGGRHGLRQLLDKRNLIGKKITVKDIAWQVSPIINASGRLGEPDKAVSLFLERETGRQEELAGYLCKLNEKRRDLGDITWKKMYDAAQRSFNETEGKFILVAGDAIHRGITGILATRMVRHFKAPVCVVAELKAKAVGSLRSLPEIPLAPFLSRFQDLFTDYGGHDMAAGFSLPLDKLEVFRARFYEVVRDFSPPAEKEDHLLVDAEIPKTMLTPDLYETAARLAPYGEAHPPLQFFTEELAVDSCDVVGKREQVHLKMILNTGTYRFPAMLWNGVELYGERFRAGERVDVVYRIQKNTYMNTETIQLIITDIARTGERTVDILRPDEDFFDSTRVVDF